jgi:hypothetical protein
MSSPLNVYSILRLIGREVGLSKTTVGAMLRQQRGPIRGTDDNDRQLPTTKKSQIPK